jgi:hypothetical protein
LDSTVSALDASLILQHVAGRIERLPSDSTLAAAGDINMEDGRLQEGLPIEVPLYLSKARNIFAFEATVTYTPYLLTLNEIVWPDSSDSFTIETQIDAGTIKIAGAGIFPIDREGIFAKLRFTFWDSLTADETMIWLEKLRWNEEEVQHYVAAATFSRTVGVKQSRDLLPKTYALEQNYPNPFWSGATSRAAGNPVTTIAYSIPRRSYVTLTIYNLAGQIMGVLVDQVKEPGRYEVRWDASRVGSGIYVLRMRADNFVATRKAVVLK